MDDAYHAFIANEIIDEVHFGSEDAGTVEKQVYEILKRVKKRSRLLRY